MLYRPNCSPTPEAPDAEAPSLSDEDLALRFADAHEDELRFVAGWGKWMRFDGIRWKPEETMLAFDYARAICRESANECHDKKLASATASASTVAAVERLAKADRKLAATTDQWDSHPFLFNTGDEHGDD